jgi:hypothetical protein
VCGIFGTQLDAVKRVFNNLRSNPPLQPTWPRLAGAGLWARLLKKQLEQSKDIITRAPFLQGEPVDEVHRALIFTDPMMSLAIDFSVLFIIKISGSRTLPRPQHRSR